MTARAALLAAALVCAASAVGVDQAHRYVPRFEEVGVELVKVAKPECGAVTVTVRTPSDPKHTGESYLEDIQWSLAAGGQDVVGGDGGGYQKMGTYAQTQNLATGEYTLTLEDLYGDGWGEAKHGDGCYSVAVGGVKLADCKPVPKEGTSFVFVVTAGMAKEECKKSAPTKKYTPPGPRGPSADGDGGAFGGRLMSEWIPGTGGTGGTGGSTGGTGMTGGASGSTGATGMNVLDPWGKGMGAAKDKSGRATEAAKVAAAAAKRKADAMLSRRLHSSLEAARKTESLVDAAKTAAEKLKAKCKAGDTKDCGDTDKQLQNLQALSDAVSAVCPQCPAGKFSKAACQKCVECPGGTFSEKPGMNACAAAAPCAAPGMGVGPGAASPTCGPCKPGTAGQTACTKCAVGSFAAAAGQMTCAACAGNTTTATAGMTACAPCMPDQYLRAKDKKCVKKVPLTCLKHFGRPPAVVGVTEEQAATADVAKLCAEMCPGPLMRGFCALGEKTGPALNVKYNPGKNFVTAECFVKAGKNVGVTVSVAEFLKDEGRSACGRKCCGPQFTGRCIVGANAVGAANATDINYNPECSVKKMDFKCQTQDGKMNLKDLTASEAKTFKDPSRICVKYCSGPQYMPKYPTVAKAWCQVGVKEYDYMPLSDSDEARETTIGMLAEKQSDSIKAATRIARKVATEVAVDVVEKILGKKVAPRPQVGNAGSVTGTLTLNGVALPTLVAAQTRTLSAAIAKTLGVGAADVTVKVAAPLAPKAAAAKPAPAPKSRRRLLMDTLRGLSLSFEHDVEVRLLDEYGHHGPLA